MFKRAILATMVSTALIATSTPAHAATVLTFEGGLIGAQHLMHFTPRQLRGDLCKSPNHCQPVDYTALPGSVFNDRGAVELQKAVDALPADEQIVLFGHSQGGQVIDSALRAWAADPAHAPDPARVSWVSIGNPEQPFGGKRLTTEGAGPPWLPTDTAYRGTVVIRQYDGWADWPDDTTNVLAVANAVVGMFFTHTAYWDVDLNDPANVRYTPDGSNVTYVWVPNKTLPLVAWAGPFAGALDNALRPIVEKAYHRPVVIPDPTPPSSAATDLTPAPASAATATRQKAAVPHAAASGKRSAAHPASARKAADTNKSPASRSAASRRR